MKSAPDRTDNWEFLNHFLATLIQLQFREITLSESASSASHWWYWSSVIPFSFLVDKKKACDSLKLVLAYTVNSKPLSCDIDCCTGTLCNTRVPQPTNASRQQEPTVKAVKMSDGVTRHSLQLGLLMMVGYFSLVIVWNTGHEERPFKTDVYV